MLSSIEKVWGGIQTVRSAECAILGILECVETMQILKTLSTPDLSRFERIFAELFG